MFVVFLFTWYSVDILACSTLEQISEIKNFQIFNGFSWTGDRPKAITLPTQHNRSSEKMQTHELVYTRILVKNLIRSRNSVWQKKSAFFFIDIINIPWKRAATAPCEASHYAVFSSALPLPTPSIFRNLFSNTLSLLFFVIPLNWLTNCHIGTVILCWDSRRKDENLPGRNIAGDPRF